MIDLHPVQSSNIQMVGYDPNTKELHVLFHSGASIYVYQQVPDDEYEAFVSADSLGRHFNQHIKNEYQFTRR